MKLMRYAFAGALFCSSQSMGVQQKNAWTWLYGKRFSSSENARNQGKHELGLAKYDTPPFGQLVFSWNAFRDKGYFSFLVQVRNAKTKRWYPWHHMMDWGPEFQRSYISTTANETNYYHVRLELPKNTYADAFRIKIETHEGASLALLKGLFICIADFAKFESEVDAPYLSSLKTVSIKDVPQQSQMVLKHPRADHLCSPTSTSMLLGFLTGSLVDPVVCAAQSYDAGLDSYGSWPFNMAYAFEYSQGRLNFCVARLNSFVDLYDQLARGIPVVVSVRGELKGAATSYPHGHLLLVRGWNARTKEVLCHDPAFIGNENTPVAYEVASFLTAWERSHRLAYLAEPISIT